jgi:hypothetical protein
MIFLDGNHYGAFPAVAGVVFPSAQTWVTEFMQERMSVRPVLSVLTDTGASEVSGSTERAVDLPALMSR